MSIYDYLKGDFVGFGQVADELESLKTQADATDALLAFGTYTPTLTHISNVASSANYEAQYFKVGNVVQVSGRFDCQATATGIVTIDVSIPIASNFSVGGNLCGAGGSNTGLSLRILAETTNNRARVTYNATSTSSTALSFIFSYIIL